MTENNGQNTRNFRICGLRPLRPLSLCQLWRRIGLLAPGRMACAPRELLALGRCSGNWVEISIAVSDASIFGWKTYEVAFWIWQFYFFQNKYDSSIKFTNGNMRLNRIWQQNCWKPFFEIDIFEKQTLSCRFQMSWSRCNRIEISPGFKFRVQKLTLCITTNWRLFSAKYCCIGCSQRPPLIFRPMRQRFLLPPSIWMNFRWKCTIFP